MYAHAFYSRTLLACVHILHLRASSRKVLHSGTKSIYHSRPITTCCENTCRSNSFSITHSFICSHIHSLFPSFIASFLRSYRRQQPPKLRACHEQTSSASVCISAACGTIYIDEDGGYICLHSLRCMAIPVAGRDGQWLWGDGIVRTYPVVPLPSSPPSSSPPQPSTSMSAEHKRGPKECSRHVNPCT